MSNVALASFESTVPQVTMLTPTNECRLMWHGYSFPLSQVYLNQRDIINNVRVCGREVS
jgi:hypothetical protein